MRQLQRITCECRKLGQCQPGWSSASCRIRVQKKSSRSHTAELYKTYYTLPVQLLHNYQILIFMHKYVHHRFKLPLVFCEYFDENKLIHRHDTRQKENFHTYVVNTEIGKRAIKFKGSMLWNNLPADIKTTRSVLLFKHKLINHLLQCLE